MAKKAYIGVGGVARKIDKIYVGVSGVARKVKKAYIGIGGVARPFWPSGLQQYGQVANALNAFMPYLAGTSVGNYALFGGGKGEVVGENVSDYYLPYVNVYNAALTRSLAENMTEGRAYLAAATVGNYAFFGGGWSGGASSKVDVYDDSLTHSSPGSNLVSGGSELAATACGSYVLFGGGRTSRTASSIGYHSRVNAYDTSLTRYSLSNLAQSTALHASASVGKYALFGGGSYGSSTHRSNVTAYDTSNSSLTKQNATALSTGRSELCATTINGHALFAGGYNGSYQNVVDSYDENLTRTTIATLATARSRLKAITMGDEYALIAGGNNGDYVDTVDVFDKNLTHTTTNVMVHGRHYHAMATVGSYALIAGGQWSAGISSHVEAYCF